MPINHDESRESAEKIKVLMRETLLKAAILKDRAVAIFQQSASLYSRAATGVEIADSEWDALDNEAAALRRKASRLATILTLQQKTLAILEAPSNPAAQASGGG